MKKIKAIYILLVLALFFSSSCDKVENPFPPAIDLDTTIYAGNWSDYLENEWPDVSDFAAMPNENRNALIEDFTGHTCAYCPLAATIAHDLHSADPTRVFVASIHASNDGTKVFQTVSPQYPIKFWNTESTDLGLKFGTESNPSMGFTGNPAGTINRTNEGGVYFPAPTQWGTTVTSVLNSTLKVGIKAKLNYYETPKHGFFLHTEIDKLDENITNDLGIVVYMIEDSVVGPQLVQSTYTPEYVHRDIMRGTLDGQTFGRILTDDLLIGDKYYVDYSYIVPDQLGPEGTTTTHNAENMHVLIFVYDVETKEIYQVIKKRLI